MLEALATLAVVLLVLDAITTAIGFRAGLMERNPVTAYLIARLGFLMSLLITRIIGFALTWLLWGHRIWWGLLILDLTVGVTVANNFLRLYWQVQQLTA